jgi:uncharacterized protein (TIGR02599 family)
MKRAGFTLLELLISTLIVVMISTMLVYMMGQTGGIWQRTAGKSEQFNEARAAFERMTTRLAQATLNTYWDYDDPLAPTKYRRRSELRFISGPVDQLLGSGSAGTTRVTHAVFFQAPLGYTKTDSYHGYENLLCTWGYFVEVGDDRLLRPRFLSANAAPGPVRPRLYELGQEAERDRIYKFTSGASGRSYYGKEWFQQPLSADVPPVHVLAKNVIALVITPRLAPADEAAMKTGSAVDQSADSSPLAPNYLYDSSPVSVGNPPTSLHLDPRTNPVHQLPPMLQVTMVACDEMSMPRLGYSENSTDPLQVASKFRQTADFTRDLLLAGGADSLESLLIAHRANYRIFSTNVVIRGARWSREQAESSKP